MVMISSCRARCRQRRLGPREHDGLSPMTSDDRKQREALFHDQVYTDHAREKLWSSYYTIVESSRRFYEEYLKARSQDADVLEYGSGLASKAFLLADHGAASVTGIDISPVAVDAGNQRAKGEGYRQVSFRVMDAEAMDFDSDTF